MICSKRLQSYGVPNCLIGSLLVCRLCITLEIIRFMVHMHSLHLQRKMSMRRTEEEDLLLSKSGVEAMVLVLTTGISLCQIFYVWGLMVPFAVLSFLQGFILFLHNVLQSEALRRWIQENNSLRTLAFLK